MARDSMLGKTIAGKLQVASVLGEGGVGVVYLAEHLILERLFAVKVLRREMASDRIAVERFHREARAASRLQHRNIVYISDFGQLPDRRFFLVMEYIPGESLADVVAGGGAMAPERVSRILLQVAGALDYAHTQGVVHRDLKPENILLAEGRGRRDTVKVLDFGLAKILFGKTAPITFKGQMFGTPEFMAPEQIIGGEMDHRVDVYALGVLTYELLTGRPPFVGSVMEQLAAHRKQPPPKPSENSDKWPIPPRLDALVTRAMEKDPEKRFASAGDMALVYRQVLTDPSLNRGGGTEMEDLWDTGTRIGAESFDPLMWGFRQGAAGEGGEPEVRKEGGKPPNKRTSGLEEKLRGALYEFAQRLRDRKLGGPRLIQQLARCLEREERLFGHKADIASMASRIEEMEAAGRQRESRLRHAVIDLGLEEERLRKLLQGSSPGAPGGEDGWPTGDEGEPLEKDEIQNIIDDLGYQIRALEKRLREVAEKRELELERLEGEIRKHREKVDGLRRDLAELDEALLEMVLPFGERVSGDEEARLIYETLRDVTGQDTP